MSFPKPDFFLDEWQNWSTKLSSCPHLDTKISGGMTNKSLLLNSDIGKLVLRINHPESANLGINRFRESVILKFLDNANIGPEIVYSDPEHRYLVYKFIDGEVWSKEDIDNPSKLDQLKSVIDQYQKIQIPIAPRNYKEYLYHYWKILETKNRIDAQLREDWQEFRPKLDTPKLTKWTATLSHHDLMPENILETNEGLRIIDWEYAHMGHADLDWMSITGETTGEAGELLHWMNRLWHLLV